MKSKMKTFLFILVASLFCANVALAGSATVSWDLNTTDSDLAGNRIYYGNSARTCTNPGLNGSTMCGYSSYIDVPGKTSTSYTFNNLTNGATYYFSVSAYDNASPANFSAFSSEVSKTIPTTTLTADLNSDGIVNSVDAALLSGSWNSTSKPKADINQDGIVNSVDAAIMSGQWTK